jgi:hypothetical protein
MTAVIPSDKEMLDISGITGEELEDATPGMVEDRSTSRQISGFESLSYVMGHPQFWRFYFRAALSLFCQILLGTLLVSFWHIKSH